MNVMGRTSDLHKSKAGKFDWKLGVRVVPPQFGSSLLSSHGRKVGEKNWEVNNNRQITVSDIVARLGPSYVTCRRMLIDLNMWRISTKFIAPLHTDKKQQGQIFGCSTPREDNIKMDLQEVGVGCGDWMELAQDMDRWRALVGTVRNLRVPKMRGISWLAPEPVSFSRRTLLHGVSK